MTVIPAPLGWLVSALNSNPLEGEVNQNVVIVHESERLPFPVERDAKLALYLDEIVNSNDKGGRSTLLIIALLIIFLH